jgi:hypothetical protein
MVTPTERQKSCAALGARLAAPCASALRDVAGECLITAACYEHRHIFDTPKNFPHHQ